MEEIYFLTVDFHVINDLIVYYDLTIRSTCYQTVSELMPTFCEL